MSDAQGRPTAPPALFTPSMIFGGTVCFLALIVGSVILAVTKSDSEPMLRLVTLLVTNAAGFVYIGREVRKVRGDTGYLANGGGDRKMEAAVHRALDKRENTGA